MDGPKIADYPDKILSSLLKFNIFDTHGNLLKWSDNIWKNISLSLNEKVRPLNLYLMWRHILTNSKRTKKLLIDIAVDKVIHDTMDISESETSEKLPKIKV